MVALLAQFAALFVGVVLLFAALTAGTTLGIRRIGEGRLRRWMDGGVVSAPVKGMVVGVVTPFCSWSTIPVALGLLGAGVRTSAVAAFFLASPVLDPVLIGVLAFLFGVPVAVGFTLFLIVATVLGGVAAERFGVERLLRSRYQVPVGAGADAAQEPVACQATEPPWGGWRVEATAALGAARDFLQPMLLPLAVTSVVGLAIVGVVPRELVVSAAGPGQPWAVPVAALAGVPLYLPTEALAPLGLGLREAGVGVGAVFALMVTAAGLSVPEFVLLAAVLRARAIVGLVALVTTVAVVGALLVPWAVGLGSPG